jgi:hypothetical protein
MTMSDPPKSRGKLSGRRVRGYRAPSYSITKISLWALDVLIDEGYEYDTSIFPIHHDRYGIPNAPRHVHVVERPNGRIVEVPPSTVRVAGVNVPIAGGATDSQLVLFCIWETRVIDYAALQRLAMFYLHPWKWIGQPHFHVARRASATTPGRVNARGCTPAEQFQFEPVAAMLERLARFIRLWWANRFPLAGA